MNEIVVVNPKDKDKRILYKEDNRTCEIEILKKGLFKAEIVKLNSNGIIEVKLLELLETRE